jgi:hypothetical protein
MKRLFITLIGLGSLFCASAQNTLGSTDDVGRIALTPVVHDAANVPQQAHKMLSNKLKQIVTRNGLGSMATEPRFVITASSQLMAKEVTATTPSFTVVEVATTLYIGDAVTGQLFSSCECDLSKGMGKNLDAAYVEAYKRINPAAPQVKQFVEEGKNKIVEYYNSQIDFLLAEADAKAKSQDFEGAMMLLASVPSVCKDAHAKAMTRLGEVYQVKIEQESASYYNQAVAAWKTAKTEESALETCKLLAKINPQSSYAQKGNALVVEIEKHYAAIVAEQKALQAEERRRKIEIEEREWQFKQQQYSDKVAADQESRQLNHELAMKQADAATMATQMALNEVKELTNKVFATQAASSTVSKSASSKLIDKIASWFN